LAAGNKRKRLFKEYSEQLKNMGYSESLFICPLCFKQFTKAEVEEGVKVSLAHVFPRSLGYFKPVTLACSECERSMGKNNWYFDRSKPYYELMNLDKVSSCQGFYPKPSALAVLYSAYLYLFYKFGYKYVFDKNSQKVRDILLEKNENWNSVIQKRETFSKENLGSINAAYVEKVPQFFLINFDVDDSFFKERTIFVPHARDTIDSKYKLQVIN